MPILYRLQTSGTIRIRADHTIDAPIIAEPPNNTALAVYVGEQNSPFTDQGTGKIWYRVEFGALRGWQQLIHDTFEQQYLAEVAVPPAEPPKPMYIIQRVPYYSQVDTDTPEANDCGEVSARIVLAHRRAILGLDSQPPTTQDIRTVWRKVAGTLTSLGTIRDHMPTFGVRMEALNPPRTDRDNLKAEIEKGVPIIFLVQNYGAIKNRQDSFTGGHILVMTGYSDQGLYVHDPLRWGTRKGEGVNLHIPWPEWEAARTGYGLRVTDYFLLPADIVKPAMRQFTVTVFGEYNDIQADDVLGNLRDLMASAQRLAPSLIRSTVDRSADK